VHPIRRLSHNRLDRQVIVNADDFGSSEASNRGIIAAFESGLISSTTLMANHGGFDEAVELAHEYRLSAHVGVHLVLTSGLPLTEPIRRRPLFCDAEGAFRNWRLIQRVWRLESSERDALALELRAQVGRVRATGLRATHLDSHHHVHNEWPVCTAVISLARELGVRHVRLARNCGDGISPLTAAYKRLFNRRLRRAGLAATRWFGDPRDWLRLKARGADHVSLADFELMTHPSLDSERGLVDSYCGGVDLRTLLAPIAAVESAVSYDGTRYQHPG
jgi:predicted glycoside hydrolase/deacetylase ChbG (UPF0249 family)